MPRSKGDSRARTSLPASVQGPRIVMLLTVLALVLIGLVMVYSASSANLINDGKDPSKDFTSQVIFLAIGAVFAVALWRVPYRVWDGPLVWAAWGLSIVLLLVTFLFGTDLYGAKRWLYIGPFGMQPSELVKIGLLLMSVRILYDARSGAMEARAVAVQALLLVLIPLFFMYKTQSDLGTTFICAVGILAVLWLGGIPAYILGGFAAIGVAFVLAAIFGTGYRSGRMVYLDPWNDGEGGLGAGYNIIRSYYAFAEGGIFGVGLGNSHEKFQYLFASESDFIFAVIGEELGMVGALVVIALFLAFLAAGLRIASEAPDDLGAMIAGGLSVMLVAQAFLNMGCAIGVFPTTGKPLPFISSGGTSLVASLSMVGLILSVSQASGEPSVYEQRRADLRVVRSESPHRGEPRSRSGGVGSQRRASSRSVRSAASGAGGSRSRALYGSRR